MFCFRCSGGYVSSFLRGAMGRRLLLYYSERFLPAEPAAALGLVVTPFPPVRRHRTGPAEGCKPAFPSHNGKCSVSLLLEAVKGGGRGEDIYSP